MRIRTVEERWRCDEGGERQIFEDLRRREGAEEEGRSLKEKKPNTWR